LAHHHAPGGRVPVALAAEDDVYNRFLVMHRTLRFSTLRSSLLIVVYVSIETLSNILGATKRVRLGPTLQLLRGRIRGLMQIGRLCLGLSAQKCT
jgi:hypothetical protein